MNYHVDRVNWNQTQKQLKKIRERVFVYEFHMPMEAEFDGLDSHSEHVLISDEKHEPVGTGRLSPDGLISRIAVIQAHRNRLAYCSLLNFLINIAKERGLNYIFVNCNLHDVPNFVEFQQTTANKE